MSDLKIPGVFWSALLMAIAGVLSTELGTPEALAIAAIIAGVAKAIEIYVRSQGDDSLVAPKVKRGSLFRWLFG